MDFPFVREAVSQLFSKPSTVLYPAVPREAAPHYRGRIVYHPEKCINCGMCERVCSGNAITTVVEKTEEGDRITRTFNLGSCTFCATCMDFCHGAIELSSDYHMIATKEEDLLVVGTHIRKPPVRKAPPPKPAAPAEKPAEAAAPAAGKEAEAPKAEEKAAEAAPAIQPRDDGKPVQDPSKCVYCTICAKKCPVGALTVDRAAKTWTLDEDLCVGCGTCAENCPKKCIII